MQRVQPVSNVSLKSVVMLHLLQMKYQIIYNSACYYGNKKRKISPPLQMPI